MKYRNKVCKKLESGNGSVAGMKMLIPFSHGATCLIEVIVKGISFDTYGNGVSVTVVPVHGAGQQAVSATDLLDDTKESRQLYFRRSAAEEFVRNNKPRNENERQWQSCMVSLRAGLSALERKDFDDRAKTINAEKTLNKMSSWELQKLLPILAEIKFELKDSIDVE